jgi:hypothetical protein
MDEMKRQRKGIYDDLQSRGGGPLNDDSAGCKEYYLPEADRIREECRRFEETCPDILATETIVDTQKAVLSERVLVCRIFSASKHGSPARTSRNRRPSYRRTQALRRSCF